MLGRHKRRPTGRSWFRRALLAFGASLAAVVLIVGVGLHSHAARQFIQEQANIALSDLFRGQLIVDRVGSVGWSGVAGVEARVLDDQGRQVIAAKGITARLSVLGLAWELLGGNPRQTIRITRVHIEEATVTFYDDVEAEVSLAGAFYPTKSDAAPSSSQNTVDVELPNIALTRVHARGAIRDQVIDADVHDLSASLRYTEQTVHLSVGDAQVLARQLPLAIHPDVRLRGELDVPPGEQDPWRVAAELRGSVDGAPVDAAFNLMGAKLSGHLHLWDIASDALNQRLPGLQVRGPTALYAEFDGPLGALDVVLESENQAFRIDGRGVVAFDPHFDADVHAVLSGVDVSGIVAAPQSKLDALLQVRAIETDDGIVNLEHQLRVLPSVLAGQRTPELVLHGYAAFENTATFLGGQLRATETGVIARGAYGGEFVDDGDSLVGSVMDLQLLDPPRLRSLAEMQVRGATRVAASWKSDEGVMVEVDARLESVRYQRASIEDVNLDAHLRGRLSDPRGQAALRFAVAAGRVDANLQLADNVQKLSLRAKRLDAAELSVIANLPTRAQRGNVDVELTARRTGEELTGDLEVNARGLDVAGLHRANIDAELSLNRRGRVNAQAEARLGRLGKVSVTVRDALVPKHPRTWSMRNAEGMLAAEGDIDLSRLSTVLAMSQLPIEEVAGRVVFNGSTTSGKSQRPSLQLRVHTEGLSFVEKREPHPTFSGTATAIAQAPTAVRGVDVQATLDVDPKADELQVSVEVLNRREPLVVARGKSAASVVFQALSDPERFAALPLTVSIQAPTQQLKKLPSVIRPGEFMGSFALDAQLSGSISQPNLRISVDAKGLRTDPKAQALELDVDATYAITGGSFEALARGGRARARAEAKWKGDLTRLAEMNERESPVHGDVSATWTAFPSAMIPRCASDN